VITLSTAATSALTRSYARHLSVQSWLGPTLLSDDVPVDTASEETDRALTVPERVTLTVPRLARGESWSPVDDDHPLACNGQRLLVRLGIGVGTSIEWIQRGWFLVQDATADGDTVTVTAVGLLALIDEARLVSPYQPAGTLVSTLRGLVEPALTVVVDTALTDRSVPTGVNYDEDRLGAVLELADAWPASLAVAADGSLHAAPVTQSTTPVLTLTDGSGGTVIKATGDSTRDGAYNTVVARGTASDGGQVQGVSTLTTGPLRAAGPFNPLPVPYFYSSPLLTTVNQCKAAADTILARLQRQAGRTYTITTVPHLGLQGGDVVTVDVEGYAGLATVESLTLPYKGGDVATLKVRTL
jgi:hypothetical protein